jgi:hypothetical protein
MSVRRTFCLTLTDTWGGGLAKDRPYLKSVLTARVKQATVLIEKGTVNDDFQLACGACYKYRGLRKAELSSPFHP